MSITKQQIEDICDTLDEFGSGTYETKHGVFHVLGLRAQAQPFELGTISHKSINDPDDQEPEQLNGICTYGIGVAGATHKRQSILPRNSNSRIWRLSREMSMRIRRLTIRTK